MSNIGVAGYGYEHPSRRQKQMADWVCLHVANGYYKDAIKELNSLIEHSEKISQHKARDFERERVLSNSIFDKVGQALLVVSPEDPQGFELLRLYLAHHGVSPATANKMWGKDDNLNECLIDSLNRAYLTPNSLIEFTAIMKATEHPGQYRDMTLLLLRHQKNIGSMAMVFSKCIVPTVTKARLEGYEHELDEALCLSQNEQNRSIRIGEALACHRAGLVNFAEIALEASQIPRPNRLELVEARQEMGRTFSHAEIERFLQAMTPETINAGALYAMIYHDEMGEFELPYDDERDIAKGRENAFYWALTAFRDNVEGVDNPVGIWLIGEYLRYCKRDAAKNLAFLGEKILMKSSAYRDLHFSTDLGL